MPRTKKRRTQDKNRKSFLNTVKKLGRWRGKKKTTSDVK